MVVVYLHILPHIKRRSIDKHALMVKKRKNCFFCVHFLYSILAILTTLLPVEYYNKPRDFYTQVTLWILKFHHVTCKETRILLADSDCSYLFQFIPIEPRDILFSLRYQWDYCYIYLISVSFYYPYIFLNACLYMFVVYKKKEIYLLNHCLTWTSKVRSSK